MLVRELMTTDVVTCDEHATLRVAVGTLLERGVGSVVLTSDEGNPTGIVTESDALRAAYRTDRPLSGIEVADLSHGSVITASPDETVQRVARRMATEGVKKVPVMDGVDLRGIVTLTDIVWHLSDIRSEAAEVAEMGSEWGPK
ncbi:CBS domain-containing protein [Halapricum desulfuricans]|uniref:CBS domain n=1 Tax=Halapricum desulfuricans TaxID=2841257 RepID=A0A897NBG5_9EURY|nr:CBS domain-containing protein [Halapricum desulfuricans]QSG10002.1 CBS domain [Halapricum desulfuricans]